MVTFINLKICWTLSQVFISAHSKMAEPRQSTLVETIKLYGNKLFRFIRGKVSSDEEAEDILQDVWYQLSALVDLDDIDSISGWLFRVARNRIVDRYRKKKDDSIEDLVYAEIGDDLNFAELLIGESTSPEEQFFKDLFWDELMDALKDLPPDQKDAFVWNEIEDMTLQEIATKTNQNIKTVISRKRYAVKHLRQRLRVLYEELNS